MTLGKMMNDVESEGFAWLIRTVDVDEHHISGAYFAHIHGSDTGADGMYVVSFQGTGATAVEAFRDAYSQMAGRDQAAALTPDTHNHREEGEPGEGATVRRSPVVTDEMIEAFGAAYWSPDAWALIIKNPNCEAQREHIRVSLAEAMRAKP